MNAMCQTHQREKESVHCWNCGGDGYSDHDCGDDCCCCLDPEPNVPCDICLGKGALLLCPLCAPAAFEDTY